MKVHELIEVLKRHDQQLDIIVDAYEIGFNALDKKQIRIIDIADCPHENDREYFEGKYNSADHEPNIPSRKAILLARR